MDTCYLPPIPPRFLDANRDCSIDITLTAAWERGRSGASSNTDREETMPEGATALRQGEVRHQPMLINGEWVWAAWGEPYQSKTPGDVRSSRRFRVEGHPTWIPPSTRHSQ